ncbi:hypothetical protein KYLE_34 [Pantoea phage Kyle]|uniref:Virion structural protein n=1 Tax=Pantoea phage Kyle TaxID=2589665 RepID=A0A514A8M9_9CAUD|nr:virion structural protein [Pantoea phage Kyle]QDH49615.1 hypothetical protein KYLE_34 [Pantoea phage Kyle]
MFQQKVNRNYPTGFPGDIVRDGPKRAKPGRIGSANDVANGNTNRISRVFGYASDQSYSGQNGQVKTLGAFNTEVTLGGANFYGVLGHPKHYVLYGGQDGALSATYDLPQYFEGEFFDMVTGLVAEIFNFGTTAQSIQYGAQLYYVPVGLAANPNKIPLGALVAVNPGDTAPEGLLPIPNSMVTNPVDLAASSATAAVNTWTIIQLTQ